MNKLYLRQFLMDNNVFYPIAAEDNGFMFKCVLYARKYVRIPEVFYIVRQGARISLSRRPFTLENFTDMIKHMSAFAADFDHIMNEFDFFKDNPIYKYRIIEKHLNGLDTLHIMKYYLSGRIPEADVIKSMVEASPEDFGEHAPFMTWLFNRYHILYRQCLELSARIKQLESKGT